MRIWMRKDTVNHAYLAKGLSFGLLPASQMPPGQVPPSQMPPGDLSPKFLLELRNMECYPLLATYGIEV